MVKAGLWLAQFSADQSGQRRAALDFLPVHFIQVLPPRISWVRGVKTFDDLDDAGQDLGKPDDVILERSLIILLVTCITLTKVKDMIVQLHVYSY